MIRHFEIPRNIMFNLNIGRHVETNLQIQNCFVVIFGSILKIRFLIEGIPDFFKFEGLFKLMSN